MYMELKKTRSRQLEHGSNCTWSLRKLDLGSWSMGLFVHGEFKKTRFRQLEHGTICTGSLRKHGITPFFYVFNVERSDRDSKERKLFLWLLNMEKDILVLDLSHLPLG